jgi:hypothetical protein
MKGKVLCMMKLDPYIYVEPQQDAEKRGYLCVHIHLKMHFITKCS